MTKTLSLLVAGCATAALLLAAGCRTTHLGQDTAGYTYKNAMRLQEQGDDAVEPPTLSADDAKAVMQVQRTGKAEGSNATTTSTPIITPLTMTSAPAGTSGAPAGAGAGMWPGATGNIVLEAK